ncbi:MAG: 16S rRNA (uracil(1498)-N(3))-methyltransferase [Verrucomicrobia bacterium]|nr:16S rRNA (uracil(1498)-N(3))-methyltransferase [Verrucomicrobiota bacterium]
MPDFRVFCTPTDRQPAELRLSAEESHHLVVVNRARQGDAVVAFDGRGTEWDCELRTDSKREAVLAVRSTRQAPPLPFDITLAQALPKGPAMDAIVRKATEIGARRIVPLETERTQVHLDGDRSDKKIEKWQIAALEAAKQCGNPWLPEITALQKLDSFLAAVEPEYDLKLIASLHPGARPLKDVLAHFKTAQGRAPKKATWLIGPEGDFSPAEMSAALTAGFTPVTLGPLVLRCETAAVYALSVLSYELQNG